MNCLGFVLLRSASYCSERLKLVACGFYCRQISHEIFTVNLELLGVD